MTAIPEPGTAAPDFTLDAWPSGKVSLKSLRGKVVVLYFYPKDDTPGCTREACDFRDRSPVHAKEDVVVLGVSRDSIESHGKFAEKYALPFTLLSDPDHKVMETYGVWVEKTNFGKTSMGVQRATFLIDKEGKIAKVWKRVKVDGHGDAVDKAIAALRK